jgi:hypothetical protein
MATIISKINIKKLGKWLLLLIWLLFIYYFSSKQGDQSLEMSNSIVNWIKNIFETSFLHLDLSFFVRKGAHVSIFFILGILSYALLKEYKISIKRRFILSFFLCLSYACMDEWHQVYVAGRDGKLLDVFIDCCGSLLSLIPLFWWSSKSQKKNRKV